VNRKGSTKSTVKKAEGSGSKPRFPYTTKPASLRRLLKEIPKKPKPTKINRDRLRSWGFSDNNDQTVLRVLKAVNLLNGQNEPTATYSQFMILDEGAKVLAPEIRRVYEPLFQASHKPYEEGNEKLQNLFNIHSGGADSSLDFQIQTFKALCENASFEGVPGEPSAQSEVTKQSGAAANPSGTEGPTININLHIHLPENKTRRDYEDIIEDIGRYIFGREPGARRE